MKCEDCNIEMEIGKYILGSEMKYSYFKGYENLKEVELEDCYKCPKCGRSEIIEEFKDNLK